MKLFQSLLFYITFLTASSSFWGETTSWVQASTLEFDDDFSPSTRLRLQNQSVFFGEVLPSDQPGVIAWRNQGFEEPFLFELAAVRSINHVRATIPENEQPTFPIFRVKTLSGDVFAGTVQRLDNQSLNLNSSILGSIRLDRDSIVSLVKAGPPGDIVYPGLVEDKVWRSTSKERDWDLKGGILTALRQGASIIGDLDLPEKCEIRLSIAWKGVPDFLISFGTDGKQQRRGPVPAVARIEVWNRNMVLVRETRQSADLTRLVDLSASLNNVELTILIDRTQGLVSVLDFSGKTLGRLSIPPQDPEEGNSLRIDNHGPSLIVERLEVRHWDGTSLLESDENNVIIFNDGDRRFGTVHSIDEANSTLELASNNSDVARFSLRQIAFIGLSPTSADLKKTPTTSSEPDNSDVEVVLSDSTRLVAQWLPADGERLAVFSNNWQRPFGFHPKDLTGLTPLNHKSLALSTSSRNGILSIGDSQFAGVLVAESESDRQNPLRWQPHGSLTSSPLPQRMFGSIVYGTQATNNRPRPWQARNPININAAQDNTPLLAGETEQAPVANSSLLPITFVNGDTIDGEISAIDDRGIHLSSSDSSIQFAEHSKIENAWINPLHSTAKPPHIDKLKMLMQIPRNMKAEPPTHLLLAINGDLLRCRLIRLDATNAYLDVRGETISMARKNIAQILWLHSRDWSNTKGIDSTIVSTSDSSESRIHLQLLNRGITLVPRELRSEALIGDSELLGACQIPIKEINQIFFGPQLDSRINEYRENALILSLMPDPKNFAKPEKEVNEELK